MPPPALHFPWRLPSRLTLRSLAIGVIVAAFCAITLIPILLGRSIYAEGFEQAERRDLLSRARHAQAAIQQSANMLAATVLDYGVWDETNSYVLGRYPTYTRENWYREAWDRLEIDHAIIFDASCRILDSGHTAGHDKVVAWPESEIGAQLPRSTLEAWCRLDAAAHGYLLMGEKPYVWGAAPVRMGGSKARPDGHIVFLRSMDDGFARKFSGTLDADVAVRAHRFAGSARDAPGGLLRAGQLSFESSANDRLTAIFELARFDDARNIEVILTTSRVFSATVRKASTLFVVSISLVGVAITLLVLGFFDRRVLAPLSGLAVQLESIGRSGELTRRVPEPPHDDEVAAVARSVNEMLAALQSKQGAEAERDAALRADSLKSEFLAMISHEIRTPMNGVIGMLELLAASDLTGTTRDRVKTAHGAATALLVLINDVLDFSKLEAGRLTLDPTPTDVGQLIRDAVSLLRPQAAAKGIELSYECESELFESYSVDSGRLRQVIANLIGNAVKFTTHGYVRVSVACSPARETTHDRLRIAVADSGVGIAADKHAAVFEPFTQEQAATARRFGGTGLGLTICRRLVTLMGGRIELESESGRGSTFIVTLDLARCARAATTPDPARGSTERLGLRVLVAEDNAVNQLVVSAMLEALGCSCELVEDGSQAVAAIEAQRDAFDVVLMDINMPVMDGYEATQRIRSHESLRTAARPLWIIALTANAMSTDRERTLSAGMDDYLSKPMTLEGLSISLRRAGKRA